MIRKFAAVSAFRIALGAMLLVTILAGTRTARAQQTAQPPAQPPAQPTDPQQQPQSQQPAQPQSDQTKQPESQESSSQEPQIETAAQRRAREHAFKKWNFNVGGGASTNSGTTKTFVRGGGGVVAGGVARNYSRYFGLRFDAQWDNLPLRSSALNLAQAPSGTNHSYTAMADLLFNLPVTKSWSGYVVVGPAFVYRRGELKSSQAVPGGTCNAFWTWWGTCFAHSLPLYGNFLRESESQFGENFGGGVARKVGNLEIYGEYRIVHTSRDNRTTDFRPITVGVRW
jgi:hypothetical protein